MLTDDDPTPVGLHPYQVLANDALKLRDAILVRAQQLLRRDDGERSDRCYRLALDVQIVLDAARAYVVAPPHFDEYEADLSALKVLQDRAELLGVVL